MFSRCAVFLLAPLAFSQTKFDMAAVERGRTQFKSSCGFCHADDATGNRAPDLIRSALLSHDVNGDTIAPVIRNGRPDKDMPAFPTLGEKTISDIVAFLHKQAFDALHSAGVSNDYPLAKLLTGNADAGKVYFNGACAGCHSPTGDLAGVAKKYKPLELQQRFLYPARGAHLTATVTLPNGQKVEGGLVHEDEFTIAITGHDGWYRAWKRGEVSVEIHDPLAGHKALMEKYTDKDVHNIFAYLETLK